MNSHTFQCDDHYEAEKLTSIVSVQRDGTVWVSGVATIIGKEVVIQLKDRSSHAVILKTHRDAQRLRDLLSEVISGRAVIRNSSSDGPVAEIVVD